MAHNRKEASAGYFWPSCLGPSCLGHSMKGVDLRLPCVHYSFALERGGPDGETYTERVQVGRRIDYVVLPHETGPLVCGVNVLA